MHRLKELLESNRNTGYSGMGGVAPKEVSETNSGFEPSDESNAAPSEKIIIFSQFLEHIHVIELQVTLKLLRILNWLNYSCMCNDKL